MRPDDVSLVVSLCRARAGLKTPAEKTYLFESRLAPVARREGFETISDMLAAVRARRDEALIWAVVEAMTQGESAFFRDRVPFELFRSEIWPTLARARGGEPVKVWSAACAGGQEIYSLAMLVSQMRETDPSVKVDLAASDISARALEKAQSGVYSQFEVQRGLPIRLLVKHFEKLDENWRLSPEIRRMVRWRRINLIAGLGAVGRWDVVFCRNVLSTLEPAYQKRVLDDLIQVLPDDGYLVLGARESAEIAGDAFRSIAGQPGVYRRNPSFKAAAA
ncbi:MAG TPA: protein-glutamate O-methyltransferase CheR [Caulobacteraceae bacterium]|nr:protein-glutamate O-methyltransferase CheR [Caulobacteraceae bacterium]